MWILLIEGSRVGIANKVSSLKGSAVPLERVIPLRQPLRDCHLPFREETDCKGGN